MRLLEQGLVIRKFSLKTCETLRSFLEVLQHAIWRYKFIGRLLYSEASQACT